MDVGVKILNRPHPSSIVALDQNRLPDCWLAGEQRDGEAIGEPHLSRCIMRRIALSVRIGDQPQNPGKCQQRPSKHPTSRLTGRCARQPIRTEERGFSDSADILTSNPSAASLADYFSATDVNFL